MPFFIIKQMALYRALLQCAPQHRHFVHEGERMCGLVPNFPNGSKCPICEHTSEDLPRIVSLDGNFRLVRKSTAGPSYYSPLHESEFFLHHDVVQNFLKGNNNGVNVDVSTVHIIPHHFFYSLIDTDVNNGF